MELMPVVKNESAQIASELPAKSIIYGLIIPIADCLSDNRLYILCKKGVKHQLAYIV